MVPTRSHYIEHKQLLFWVEPTLRGCLSQLSIFIGQRVEPTTTACSEGAVDTSALPLASALPSRLLVKDLVSVPHEFLHDLVDRQQELAEYYTQIDTSLSILFIKSGYGSRQY